MERRSPTLPTRLPSKGGHLVEIHGFHGTKVLESAPCFLRAAICGGEFDVLTCPEDELAADETGLAVFKSESSLLPSRLIRHGKAFDVVFRVSVYRPCESQPPIEVFSNLDLWKNWVDDQWGKFESVNKGARTSGMRGPLIPNKGGLQCKKTKT